MKSLLYRMNSRRKYIVKSTIIISLLSLSSIFFLLVPQLIHPTILQHYFYSYAQGAKVIDTSFSNITLLSDQIDFTFGGEVDELRYLNNFNMILSKASKKAYDMFDPESNHYFAYSSIEINSTKNGLLLGVSDSLFDQLHDLSGTMSGNENDVILLKLDQNENLSLGLHSIKINNKIVNLTVNYEIPLDIFLTELPSFYAFLNSTHNRIFINEPLYIYFLNKNHFTFIWQSKMGLSVPLKTTGYVLFSYEQKAIIYWSLKSEKMIATFMLEMKRLLLIEEPSLDFRISAPISYAIENNAYLVQLVNSFIRSIQLFVWGIAIFVLALTVNKVQKINREQEVKIILTGQSWRKRTLTHFLDSFLLTGSSLAISLGILYPLVKFQSIFDIQMNFTKSFFIGFGIIFVVEFLIIFSVLFDYELYLRKMVTSNLSMSEKYSPLMFIPWYAKIIGVLIFLVLLWVANRDYNLLYLGILLIISIIICLLTVLIVRLAIRAIMKRIYHNKRKENKKLSTTLNLFQLRKKFISGKFFTYSLVLSIILSSFLFSSVFADTLKTDFTWWVGGEITFESPKTEISSVDYALSSNSDLIIDYTKFINIFSNKTLKPFLGEERPHIIGIDKADYFTFFSSRNTKRWLAEGTLNNFNESTIFVSKKFRTLGYKIGDIIKATDNTSLVISGIIGAWPAVTDRGGTHGEYLLQVIMDENTLQTILNYSLVANYQYRYMIHSKEQHIDSIIDLILEFDVDEIEYIDTLIYSGLKRVFLLPIIMVFGTLILFWFSLFTREKLEGINSSPEARSLGILALSTNYRKPFLFTRLFESFIHLMIFLIIVILSVVVSYTFISLLLRTIIFISPQTYFNILLLMGLYSLVHLFQVSLDYWTYHRLNLSLLYRHPE